MQLGIMAKTFSRPTFEETLDAVVQHGLHSIQFNMTCVDLPSMPDAIDPSVVVRIQAEMSSRQISMAAVSGTFNMAHPDPQIRRDGLRRLGVLSTVCKGMGTSMITLCTGTRDARDMWHWHDENTSSAAWHDMIETVAAAVEITENTGVTMAFEPERANVIYNAQLARKLLNSIASPHLKVIMDAANIIDGRNPAAMADVLDEAFDLLGDDIVMAHAKDRGPDDNFRAAGKGVLDYSSFLKHLNDMHFEGDLIIHSLEEEEVDSAVQMIQNTFRKIATSPLISLS
jgi:sugar phosphate isomerase/epimerase